MSDTLVESYTKLNKKHQETLKENKRLKEQLAEKDKEIEELKEFYDNMLQNKLEVKCVSATEEKIKEIRKQVCDEIRDRALDFYYFQSDATKFDGNLYLLSKFDLENILDKIEQGE